MFRIGHKLKSPRINLSAYEDLTPNSPLGTFKDKVSVSGLQAIILNYPLIKIILSDLGDAPSFPVPPPGTWFACTMGITPCINSHAFTGQNHEELCVLTYIIPQVYLYEGEASTYKFPHLFLIMEQGEQHYPGTCPNRHSWISHHRSFCINNWRYREFQDGS
jgi:hypothetical protein